MKKSRKRLICILSVLAVLVVLSAIACVVILNRGQELDALQQEKLTELQQHEGEYDPQSIVLYDTTAAAAEKLADKLGAALRISQDGKFAALKLPEGKTIADVYADDDYKGHLAEMSVDYQVKASELSEESVGRMPTRPTATVNDPSYSLQTYLDYLNLGTVWNKTKGSGITVAIIDTGIDIDHPEFEGRISEYSYNATEDKIVKDYVLEDGSYDWSLVEDEQGHGTGVAGALGASMNNGEGIVGVAPEVTILVIKAECNANGAFARTSDLVFGLYYAIERDVDVVNMSFGTYLPANPFADATKLAVDSDVICVAAAGNDATTALSWPAADENVIGVGALAADSWELATYSNYGDNVDIVAPGTTYTAKMGGGYATTNGTSLASPVAAGVISLALSQERYATYEEICTLLYASSYDLGDLGADWDYGYGAIDATALILEERGTITYDMLTDELEDETGIFIRNHTLQEMPEPERLYAIFDGWYYDPQCTQPYMYYEDRFVTDLTLYAHWVNEEDGVPYTYVELDDGTIEIRSYTGRRKYITIPEMIDGKPVTSIGDFAFSGESNLREIWLPDCLTHIGRYAFEDCSNLLHIDIPVGVTEIEEGAFYNNVRLSYVAFAGNSALTTIGNKAFAYCSKLTRFEVPAGVTSLNGSAFLGTTSMQNISVHINNTAFTAVNGVLLNYTASTVVAYPAGRTGNEALPTTVRTIGAYAFAYTKRTEIALDDVQSIGAQAFVYAALENVEIPDSVTSMGEGAFAGNFYLREVALGAGLTAIPQNAFAQAYMLTSIEIPAGIAQISGGAFAVSGLRTVTFAENSRLMVIGANAFAQSALTGIEIPASVMAIGDMAFVQNFALSSITFAEGSNLISIGSSAFAYNVSLTAITFPARLTTLGEQAFAHSGLTGTVTLPASLTSFGAGAFASCAGLTAFAVEEGNIAYKAVEGVVYSLDGTALVAYPTGNAATSYTVVAGTQTIASRAFGGAAKLSAVTLPETLTAIEEYGMSGMTALTRIAIPDNVMRIGRYAFSGNAKMTSATFGEGSKLPRIGYAAFAYSGLTSFTVPANVSTMAQGVFEGCSSLRTMAFAANSKLESISAYMFDGCTALTTVTFQNGSALTSIQAHGFEGMSNLTIVNFGDAELANIDNFAFRFCDSLKTLTLPNTLTNIGRYAFYYCTALTDLALPASVEHIGSFAFLGTSEMNIYFAAETLPLYLDEDWDHGIAGYYLGVTNVVTEGDWQYATLASGGIAIIKYNGSETVLDLTALGFGDIVNIGGSAFAYTAVESITLPDTLVTIQAEAFYHSALQSVTVPASVQFIGREAFADTPLSVLTFAENSALKVIEQSAFEGTKSLGTVTLPASLTTMGRAAFRNSGITVLNFAENIGLTEIADEAFAYTNITTLTLPDSITEIGDGAFRGTAALESVTFGMGELMIRSNAFYQSGLKALNIPENVTYIGEYAFVAMPRLTAFNVAENNPYYKAVDGLLVSKTGRKLIAVPAGRTGELTLPVSIEVIGFGAFESTALSAVHFDEDANILSLGYRAFFGAKNLSEIHIPASVVAIDYYAFANCSALTTVTFAEGNQLRGVYEGAFYACKNLSNIILPDSINEISDFAFYGCAKLTALPVSETSTIKGIYSYAMAYTGIQNLILPETVIDLGDYAFMGTKLQTVTIPATNQKDLIIGIGAFAECNNLTEITLPFIGASFEDRDITWFGYIFGAGGYQANSTYVPASLKTVNINGDITAIPAYAFYQLSTIESIDVPETVDTIYYYAFYGTVAKYELHQAVKLLNVNGTAITWLSGRYTLGNDNLGLGILGHLELAEGVTSIGISAFYGCTGLTSITIPSSVTSIGFRAFYKCTSLTSITIPSSMTSIGDDAFDGCTGLTSITIPSSVTSIGNGAFSGCTGLTSITIPSSVTSIGEYAFSGCTGLTSITIPSSVTSIGKGAFEDCTRLKTVIFAADSKLTSIGAYAFYGCMSLTSITIPSSVTIIDSSAFHNCTSLPSIVIPEGVTDIGGSAFRGCKKLYQVTNLSTLTFIIGGIDNGYVAYYARVIIDAEGNKTYKEENSGFTYIDTTDNFRFVLENDAYTLIAYLGTEDTVTLPTDINGCSYSIYQMAGVKNVIIPQGVTSIGSSAFEGCTSLTSITIPSSVTSIGFRAFEGCTSLTNVSIGDNSQLTSIGSSAFEGCTSLTSITIPDGVTSIGSGVFSGCFIYNFIIGEDNRAFVYKEGVLYNKNITQILYVFEGVTSVCIPKTIELISRAFKNKIDIVSVTFEEGSQVTSIDFSAFKGCTSLTSITIPSSVTDISDWAFYGCTALTSITIPEGVTNIGSNAFNGCTGLEKVIISDLAAWCKISFGDSNANPLYYAKHLYLGENEITELVIPSSVTSIGSSAFSGCTSLTSITIPLSVTSIGEGAFRNCTGLTSITIPSSVTSIGDDAFDGCTGLTSITIPSSVTSIGNGAFSGCTSLTSITIPSSVTNIGDWAFYGCTGLEKVIISDLAAWCKISFGDSNANPLYYAKHLYLGENEITELVIPSSVTSIGSSAFSGCTSLTSITIPSSVTNIGDWAFNGCTGLKTVIFAADSKLTSIGAYAFSDCTGLTSITIPSSVTSIGSNAFRDCTRLYQVTNLSSLALTIGSTDNGYVAYYAKVLIDAEGNKIYKDENSGFTYIDTEDGFRFMLENGAYTLIAYLGTEDTVTLPVNINGQTYSIYQMRGVKNVIILEGVISIDDRAFYECSSLASITIPSSMTSIGDDAFYGCTGLTSITIPSSVTSIGKGAFEDCTRLKTVIFAADSKLTSIGAYAFYGCTSLASIMIPSSVTSIGNGAFANTAYYNDGANWADGALYIGNHLIDVDTSVKFFTVREGTVSIATDAFTNCYSLRNLTIGGDHIRLLSSLTNLETLVITELPTHPIYYYFDYDASSIPLTFKNIMLADDVRMRSYAFSGITGFAIYAEATENDTRWDDNFPGWNNGNAVVYGDKWINATFYNPDGSIYSKEIFTTSQVIRVPYLEIAGNAQYTYELAGWDLDGDGVVDTIPATSTIDIVASPIVVAHTNSYTVTFLDKDGTTPLYTYVLPYGSIITLSEAPTKKGYTFLGWGGYTEGMAVEGDITITSVWQHEGRGHTYAAPVWVDPSCTEQGYNKHICTVCDEWYGTDYVAELGHTYTDSTVASTCAERGYDLHACACGHSYMDNFVDANGHSFGDWHVDVAVTCTETGSQHRDCANCDATEIETIAAAGHAYTATVLRKATCSAEGVILHVCSDCGSQVQETIEKAEHNYQKKYASKSFLQWLIDWILDVFFGYEGNQAYYYECVNCRHIQTAEERMLFASVMGVCIHEYGDVQLVKSATCTEQGVNGRVCALCGAVSDATTFDALGHDHSEISTISPTCMAQGYTRHDCSRCDDYYCTDFGAANGHTASDWIIDKAATCTSIGYKHKECTVCETILETAEIAKVAHTEVKDLAVAATCTASGLTEGKHCSVCNTVLVAQTVVNAKGHSASDWITDKVATCTSIGYKHKECTVCETILETAEIAKVAHTEVKDLAVAATCTATGLTEGKHCSVCNTVLVAQTVVNAKSHTASNWVVDKSATCESDGYQHKECTVCETILETESIDALGHEYSSVITAPTEAEMGYTTKSCSRCQHTLRTDYEAPLDAELNSEADVNDADTSGQNGESAPVALVVVLSAAGGIAITSAAAFVWSVIKKKKHV